MSGSLTLAMLLTLRDMASGPLGQFANNVQSMSAKLVSAGAEAQFMGQKMLGGLAVPIKAFTEAEDAATRLKVAMMGSDGSVSPFFGKVNALATDLGKRLPGTAKDFQLMMTTLVEQGMSGQAILNGVGEAAGYLAVQLRMPFDAAAKFSAKLGEAAGVAEKDMMRFMDVIQRTANVGVAADEMGLAFGRSAGKLKEVGAQGIQSAADLSVMFAQLIKNGLSGETVGTNFAGLLGGLQQFQYGIGGKAKDAQKDLKALGIQMEFFDKAGKFLGPREMIAQLEKLNKLKPDQKASAMNSLFGNGQDAQMVSTLISGGVKAYDQMAARQKQQASLQMKVNEVLGTFKNVWEAAQGAFETAMAGVGGAIAPELKALAGLFDTASEKLGVFVQQHPQVTKFAALFTMFGGGALVAGGSVLVGAGMVGRAMGPLGSALTFVSQRGYHVVSTGLKVSAGMKAWNASTGAWAVANTKAAGGAIKQLPGLIRTKTTALAASGKGALVALPGQIRAWSTANTAAAGGAIRSLPGLIMAKVTAMRAATMAGMAWVRTNLLTVGGLRALAATGWAKIAGGFRAVALAVRAMGLAALGNPLLWVAIAIAGAALLIFKYWRPIAGFFKGLWQGLKVGLAPLKPAFDATFKALAPILNPVIGALRGLWNWLKNLLKPVDDVGNRGQKMGLQFGMAIADMIKKGAELLSSFTNVASQMFSIGVNIVQGLWNGMKSTWSGLTSWASSAASGLTGLFSGLWGVRSPSRVFMGLGNNLGQGLEIGMRGQLGAVHNTAKLMAKAAIPAMTKLAAPGLALPNIASLPPGRAGTANGDPGSGGHNFTYAPVIQMGSQAAPGVRSEVETALKDDYQNFRRMMMRWEHDERRISAR